MAHNVHLAHTVRLRYDVLYITMKKTNRIVHLLAVMAIGLISCGSDSSCTEEEVPITDLSDLGCMNAPFTVSVQTLNEYEIIRNQEDYDLHIDAKCNPEIDWVRHDLIAGMVGLSRGLATIDKQLIMNCNTNRLVLTVDISTNITAVAPLISYNAIIPKLEGNQVFNLEVNVTN